MKIRIIHKAIKNNQNLYYVITDTGKQLTLAETLNLQPDIFSEFEIGDHLFWEIGKTSQSCLDCQQLRYRGYTLEYIDFAHKTQHGDTKFIVTKPVFETPQFLDL